MSTSPDQSTKRPNERLSIIVHPSGQPGNAPRVLVPCEGRECTDALLANGTLNSMAASKPGDDPSKAGATFVASPISINGDYRRQSKIINTNGTPTEAVTPSDAVNRMSVATATVLYPPPPSLPLRIQAPMPITLVLSPWQHLLWVLGPLCLAGALGALVVFLTNHFHASSAVHLVVISAYFFLSFLFLGFIGMEMRSFAQRKWKKMVKREELGRSAGEVWRTEQIPLDEWQEWRLRRRDTERSTGTDRKIRSSPASIKKEGMCGEPLTRGQGRDVELGADGYEEADQTDMSGKEDASWARASYQSRHSLDNGSLSASTRANASTGHANVDTSDHSTHRYAHSVTDAATIAPSTRLGTQSSQRAPTLTNGRAGSAGGSSASVMAQNAATVATRSQSSSRGRSRSPSKTTAYTYELSKVANASTSASVSASSSAATKGRGATDETAVEVGSAHISRRSSLKSEARQFTVTGAGVVAGMPVPTLAKEATLKAIPMARPAAPWKMPVNMPNSGSGSANGNGNGNTSRTQQAQIVAADRAQIYQGAAHHQVSYQQQQHKQQQQQTRTQTHTQGKPSEERYHHPFPRVVSTSEGDAFADAEESADASLIARARAVAARAKERR
ncbi:hypothetical protein BCV69DRAFT_295689 [Microstroma glucosiphilum]|uniref:Uncharacterized protein n=1 Tax=Pseudomicrostroma glucosiphilum TaxID=1684307 RepID=A0A316TWC1_9BASI|nr:hypothetical protein BCV69DRAFT_295689 [Pseudomicrostroma glucosiphilum]PWN17786.1 hypothetical protein BCV69DRAFT_295689 [Pseudomicrostroma glucosiphilum]